MVQISELHRYPIKSCAGTSLNTATFTDRGIQFDREWMVADADGTFMSQRKTPELALVSPALVAGRLCVTAPGMEELAIDLADVDYPRVNAVVWGSEAPAIAQGAEADEWFSDYLKRPVQFVRTDPIRRRSVKEIYQVKGVSNKVGFADSAPLLLMTAPSLRVLNERLETPVPMNRFRPNVVVDGEDLTAFDEDFWRRARLGELEGIIGWGCTRCVIPETDQATAVRGKQVLKVLQGFRKGKDAVDPSNKGVFIGQNFLHVYQEGVTVSVGDSVEVLERSEERNILGLPD